MQINTRFSERNVFICAVRVNREMELEKREGQNLTGRQERSDKTCHAERKNKNFRREK